MPLVMLRRTWPGNFRRTVTTDKAGKKTRVVEFTPGEPVELNANEVACVIARGDLGNALLPVELDENGKVRIVEDAVASEEEPAGTTEPTNAADTV